MMKTLAFTMAVVAVSAMEPSSVAISNRAGGPEVDNCSFDGKLGYCLSACPSTAAQKPGICPLATDICCVTPAPAPTPAPGQPTPPPSPPTPAPTHPPIKGKRLVPVDGSVLHCAGQMNDGMTITDQIPYPGNFTGFTGYNGTNACGDTSACDPHKANCGLCSGYGCCGG